MSRIILLDAGPLGLLAQPRPTASSLACRQWAADMEARGVMVQVAEIADYEVRRELLRARKVRGVARLNQLKADFGYIRYHDCYDAPSRGILGTTAPTGTATAPDLTLDADVILAAQAALLIGVGYSVVIATTNVAHLSRLVPADLWQAISG